MSFGAGGDEGEEKIDQHDATAAELPFLVTHWLANYGQEKKPSQSQIDQDAVLRIRRAASEIASAFSALGAYGTSNRVGIVESGTSLTEQGAFGSRSTTRNASFADVARRWPGLSTRQLETVVRSSASNTVALQSAAQHSTPSSSILEAAFEAKPKSTTTDGGRRLGGPIEESSQADHPVPLAVSALHRPTLISDVTWSSEFPSQTSEVGSNRKESQQQQRVALFVESDYKTISQQSSEATHRFLSLRKKIKEEQRELHQLRRSLERQREMEEELRKEQYSVTNGTTAFAEAGEASHFMTRKASAEASRELEAKVMDIQTRKASCERVTAHIRKKQTDIGDSLVRNRNALRAALAEAGSSFKKGVVARWEQRDPFQRNTSSLLSAALPLFDQRNHRIAQNVVSRQYGGGGSWNQSVATLRTFGRKPSQNSTTRLHKAIVSRSFSHVVTINAHLAYPVYCLRFDRTGRFFVTGADDFLVKLFHLGPRRPGDRHQVKHNTEAMIRGAVLVCTLRGHAGVICDIDVSMDNALLATASEDGDCRIWGLKDGCPVAILRGHSGGANMVSWSSLTPYRLATIGSDGLARVWDVREAALKRYGAFVGKRLDYLVPVGENDRNQEGTSVEPPNHRHCDSLGANAVVLPPLPQRDTASQIVDTATNAGNDALGSQASVSFPPIPQGDVSIGEALNNVPSGRGTSNAQNEASEGAFVADNGIDEGVRLIAKLQHGDVVDEDQNGPSTRSRRKAVKIICVARCPLGGHFATGSDDGLGRIWSDMDDHRVERVDQKYYTSRTGRFCKMAVRHDMWDASCSRFVTPVGDEIDQRPRSSLLATLSGHMNAITDLFYSNAGDRILTASERDGVVRIWSWASESASGERSSRSKFSDLRQVLIRLTNPMVGNEGSSGSLQPSRRRAGGGASVPNLSRVCCDVAVWTSDDSKIITSQCCPIKPGNNDVVPGSQFLFIWDSRSGRCLMGISAAHAEACNVLVPHPSDSSMLCSAGADGRIRIWDLDSGECHFTHQNTVDYGPVEPVGERGKKSGYLDGSFSPDGLRLTLTDDSGRITVLDVLDREGSHDDGIRSKAPLRSPEKRSLVPSWTKEQYFANDYYELYYDTNGYCVERGSQLPPHLAPRAARCSHSGTPYPDSICRAYRKLVGPLPLPDHECRWQRELTRSKALKVRRVDGPLLENVRDARAVIVSEFDPERTFIINSKGGHIVQPHAQKDNSSDNRQEINHSTSSSNRQLSSNFRWGDYDDILREEEGEDGDSEDEEFVVPTASLIDSSDGSDDGSEDDLSDSFESTTERSMRVIRRRQNRERAVAYEREPTRVSERQLLRDARRGPYVEPDSDEDVVEYLSTNNTPSGTYVTDYTRHFFRLPDRGFVKRSWLCRGESRSSYAGTKNYAPQVGDSVVYIPRAHYDTIRTFPTLEPPWTSWPTSSAWPVLRCRIRNIRYRFPYKEHYRKQRHGTQCLSIVAILTLEVTGIPEIAQDRRFPWPKPYFVSRQTRSSKLIFEVSVFEGSHADFVIPEQLYLWRLKKLEAAVGERAQGIEGLQVVVYFSDENASEEDPAMVQYRAQLVGTVIQQEPGAKFIHGSGYETLEIEWESGGTQLVSAWEITVATDEPEFPLAPCMSDTAKRAVLELLSGLEGREDVREWFSHPVNVDQYSDYLNRIEIPMDFGFIRKRVAADYYSNKLSVLSDVQLIRDNCIKYNDTGNEMSNSATEIYDVAERATEEIDVSDAVFCSSESPPGHGQSEAVHYASSTHVERRSSRRTRTNRRANGVDGGTSLECLPPPTGTDATVPVAQNISYQGSARERRRIARAGRATGGPGENVSTRRMTRSSVATSSHFPPEAVLEDEMSDARVSSSSGESSPEEDQISDDDSSSEEEQSCGSVSSEPMPRRRSAPRTSSIEPSSMRTSPRRTRTGCSYVEIESDADEVNESSEEEELVHEDEVKSQNSNRKRRNGSVKRVEVKRARRGNSPKRRRGSASRTEQIATETELPELLEWPDIEIRDITKVAKAVMKRMMASDEAGIFAVPVSEAYPEDAEEYLNAVELPMDYRTIMEDRIPAYESITELQDDLTLVFRNCTTYNEANSDLWSYAVTMWDMVNDVFRDVCDELDVLLPRRWTPR